MMKIDFHKGYTLLQNSTSVKKIPYLIFNIEKRQIFRWEIDFITVCEMVPDHLLL